MSGPMKGFLRKFYQFRSSIYGRVVFIITGSLLILFILFLLVFRTIYTDFFNETLGRSGDQISSIVEGSLYYSMLENDQAMLQRTLDMISTMSGIDEVNMYDQNDLLAYSSLTGDPDLDGNPSCTDCHSGISSMFPPGEKAYLVVENIPECGIRQTNEGARHLLIKKSILNEPSCSTADCHYHPEDEPVLGSLLITMPLDDLDAFADQSSTDFMLLATLITVLMVTFLVLFTRRRIKRPLNSLIQASERVSGGDHSIRLEIKPGLLNDMRLVSEAFNNMLDNIEMATKELQNWSRQLEYKVQKKSEELSAAQNELIHVERIASLGKLSSSVAHEINNPLSGILVYNRLIHKQLDRPEFHHPKKESILKNLKLIETETKRCGDIVRGLLDFSRQDREDFEPCHLHGLLSDTCKLMRHSIKIADIQLTNLFHAENDLIHCSPNQIKQVCVAIMVNATEAIRENGEITVRTSNPDEKRIRWSVTDNGVGIAPGDISHIFEPFYSTKRDTSGIGLGLSIVHGIVENHQGKIEVDSEPGRGTTISIILPLAEEKPSSHE